MREFVDQHRQAHGVEPICRVLQIAPSGYWRYVAQRRLPALRSARARRDEILVPHIERIWQANLQVCGADKVWHQLNREGILVARCKVERLIRPQGLRGVRRGKVVRTTISDSKAACPLDRVNRMSTNLTGYLSNTQLLCSKESNLLALLERKVTTGGVVKAYVRHAVTLPEPARSDSRRDASLNCSRLT